jgi:hypothetical protein
MGWEYFLDFEYLAELRHADRVIEGEGGCEYVIPSSCRRPISCCQSELCMPSYESNQTTRRRNKSSE